MVEGMFMEFLGPPRAKRLNMGKHSLEAAPCTTLGWKQARGRRACPIKSHDSWH